MTEKIMIDDVDVGKCKHYDREYNFCDQSYLGEGGLLKNTKNPKSCSQSPNCYYKQLKREQERSLQAHKDTVHNLVLLKRKMAELEQYKNSKQASYEHFQKRCNELELENRKLKIDNQTAMLALEDISAMTECTHCDKCSIEVCEQRIAREILKEIGVENDRK